MTTDTSITGFERVHRCLEFRSPDRAPRELWTIPWVQQYAREDWEAHLRRFPIDFAYAIALGSGDRCRGEPSRKGNYTDAWGSGWSVGEDGVQGEVKAPALEDWSALDSFQPPWEVLRRGTWDAAQRACEENRKGARKFMRCRSGIRPFEQMQWLRGTENTFVDLGEESPEFFRLLAMLHEFYREEVSRWTKLDCDAICFYDDWGSQRGLLISPAQWRKIFKPLYREYFQMVHKAGKKVFYHSDGNIVDLYEEFIEVGVDAINSQLFCMDIEEIARRFKGRIAFWGEIDRQRTLPFGTPADVYRDVARVRRSLDDGRGGVIAQCSWEVRDPPENIAAVYEAWEMPLPELLATVDRLPPLAAGSRPSAAAAKSP